MPRTKSLHIIRRAQDSTCHSEMLHDSHKDYYSLMNMKDICSGPPEEGVSWQALIMPFIAGRVSISHSWRQGSYGGPSGEALQSVGAVTVWALASVRLCCSDSQSSEWLSSLISIAEQLDLRRSTSVLFTRVHISYTCLSQSAKEQVDHRPVVAWQEAAKLPSEFVLDLDFEDIELVEKGLAGPSSR